MILSNSISWDIISFARMIHNIICSRTKNVVVVFMDQLKYSTTHMTLFEILLSGHLECIENDSPFWLTWPHFIFKQVKIPLPYAVLHNFIHIISRSDDFFRDFYKDAVVVQDIDPKCPHIEEADEVDDDTPEGGWDKNIRDNLGSFWMQYSILF